MRISDDRYCRDLRRFELAWRLLGHGARTATISEWTGLSHYRILNLYRSYARDVPGTSVRRPRGRSPYKVELLLESRSLRHEATLLAQVCVAGRVFAVDGASLTDPATLGVGRGELICAAFELFQRDVPKSRLTIEHALLLVASLTQRKEIEMGACSVCGGVLIVDRVVLRPQQCVRCSGSTRRDPGGGSRSEDESARFPG